MRTIEDFYNEFEKTDIEIAVYVTTGFGGALQLEGSRQITSYFSAMIDLNTNELIELDGRIEQVVTSEAFSQKQYVQFKDNGIYKLLVSKCIPKELSPNTLPAINNRYLLKRVESSYDVINEPKELVAFRESYLKPVSVRIGDAEFVLNRRFKWYEATISIDGNNCRVTLHLNKDAKTDASNAITVYETIAGEFEKWIARAKEKATSELLDEANAWREDDSLPEYTEELFMGNMDPLIEIEVKNNKSFEMVFQDNDMFAGHWIVAYCNISDGVSSCSIEG